MVHVALPMGMTHGWGIAGKSITKELAKLTPVQLVTEPFSADTVGDVLEFLLLASLVQPGHTGGEIVRSTGSVLQGISGVEFEPYRPGVRGVFNVGYTFFED